MAKKVVVKSENALGEEHTICLPSICQTGKHILSNSMFPSPRKYFTNFKNIYSQIFASLLRILDNLQEGRYADNKKHGDTELLEQRYSAKLSTKRLQKASYIFQIICLSQPKVIYTMHQ